MIPLMTISLHQDTFLILLTDASIVATLPDDRRSTISTINSLLAVPLSDGDSARAALAQFSIKLAAHSRRRAASTSTGDNGDTDETSSGSEDDDDDEAGTTTDGGDTGTETEADARPPFTKVGIKRPFWTKLKRTLSSKSNTAEQATPQTDAAVQETAKAEIPNTNPLPRSSMDEMKAAVNEPAPTDPDVLRAGLELDRKVLGETLRTIRGMYFSYSIDVTRSLQAKDELRRASREGGSSPGGLFEPNPTLPLWRRADKRFFWNAHLMQPFIEAGVSSSVLGALKFPR